MQAALSHGEGSGWQSGYRFRVVQTGENRWMAVFLDCRKEVRSLYRLAGVSVAAMAVCVALVYLIPVVLFLAGYLVPALLGASVGVQYAVAVCGFLAGILFAIRYDRRLRAKGGLAFTIVRLF